MTTPEQQALQLAAQAWCTPATSSLEMDVNLATAVAEKFAPIIAERDALKAELEAIQQGAGEPVACLVRHRHLLTQAENAFDGRNHYSDWSNWEPGKLAYGLAVTHPSRHYADSEPAFEMKLLYTRPCVSLTDDKVKELICERFVTGENLFNEVHQDYRFRSRATERNVWGRDLLAFARDVEAHIKGAK